MVVALRLPRAQTHPDWRGSPALLPRSPSPTQSRWGAERPPAGPSSVFPMCSDVSGGSSCPQKLPSQLCFGLWVPGAVGTWKPPCPGKCGVSSPGGPMTPSPQVICI